MPHSKAMALDRDWKIAGFDFNVGLARRAYAADYQPRDWVPAHVPMTVQQALFQAGRIPDPYVGFNAQECVWVEGKEWWYFKDFTTPAIPSGRRVVLRFEGITYRAEVWVNGIQAGRIEGMFRTDEFDVTDWLRPAGVANRLTLRVRAQENASQEIDGSHSAVRSQGPVAQSMYSWNWCPHLVCVGIWRPVTLLLRHDLRFELARIRTLRLDLAKPGGPPAPVADAVVQVEWLVRNGGSRARDIVIDYKVAGETFAAADIAAGRLCGRVGAGAKRWFRVKLSLPQARLWWPNGLGRAELHCLSSVLSAPAEGVAEEKRDVFGVRRITWRRNDRESWVLKTTGHTMRPWAMVGRMYKWTMTVNGRKVFMKGSNWVKLDALLRLEPWRYERQLKLARAGGLNYLRVWGGSLAETDEFYDLCDRYGLLCWQEFWLACGNYPAMDHDLFIRCVRDTVKRLVNRACLTHYCGGNEYQPDNLENKVLVDKIAAAVGELDPEREFRRGSPYKGDRHGGLVNTPLVTRNKYLDILYGESRIVLMRSEVATGRSLPMMSSFEKMVPPGQRWPVDEKSWRNFFGVPCEFLGFAKEYDALDDFMHAVMANHLAHGQLCRVNMEFCRSRMFRCSGNLNWQFNVPWPCMHRELVDTWGVPKPAYYYYINASRPRLACLDLEKYLWHPGEIFNPAVFLVNDLDALDGLTVTVRLFSTATEKLCEKQFACAARANAATRIGALDYAIPRELAGETIFALVELFQGGRRLHRNLYWAAISRQPAPAVKIGLDGVWERPDGTPVTLPGNDMRINNPSFEYIILKQKTGADLETQGDAMSAASATGVARYRRKFRVPPELRGQPLEFHTPGIEGSDEVFVNGCNIGAHTMPGVTLDTAAWCFVPHGKEQHSLHDDPASEYMFYSDPIVLPRLQPRFYDISAALLNADGDNEIELVLKTNYQKAISNRMDIRPLTPDRAAVAQYFREGVVFAGLRRMPPARLEVEVAPDRIVVRNASGQLAFLVLVELIPDATGIAVPLDDNALALLPGETVTLRHMYGETWPLPAAIRVDGWNVAPQRLRAGNPA